MIRPVRADDVPAVVALVHELADYEREPGSCTLTAAQLAAALFAPAPALFGHVAEVDGEVVGCALWFLNFSTWRGVHGVYLEDLYIRPAHRGSGLGRALLARLAAICADRGYARLEWSVLDWNAPSIEFYRSIGAVAMDGWTTYRLDGPALAALGGVEAQDVRQRESGRSRSIDQSRDASLISRRKQVMTSAPAAIPSTSWRDGPSSE
jgi:GNAT superfamily N-acetyltransferase